MKTSFGPNQFKQQQTTQQEERDMWGISISGSPRNGQKTWSLRDL